MTEMAFYPEIEQHEEGMLDVGDGQSIHWAVCGNPEGKPAVVLHGGVGLRIAHRPTPAMRTAELVTQCGPRGVGDHRRFGCLAALTEQ